jgi:hypothetical protein
MLYTAKAAVCSHIQTKHWTQSEHHVEFWTLNLAVRKETARLLKIICFPSPSVCSLTFRPLYFWERTLAPIE